MQEQQNEYKPPVGLIKALTAAKEQFDPILKNGVGKVKGQTKSGTWYEYEYQYALFEDIIHATDQHLADNKLVVHEDTIHTDKGILVKVILSHESGETTSCSIPAIVGETKKSDMQALGAAISYARRYARCLLLGIVAEQDDDGSRARDNESKKAAKIEKDKDDKSRTAGTKKKFIKDYYTDIDSASDLDSLDILIVSHTEDYNAVLSTYTPDIRDQVEAETTKRILNRRKELEAAA